MATPRVQDKFGKLVKVQTRRLTGVTPAVTKPFAEQPWKFLPKATGLRSLASSGKRS